MKKILFIALILALNISYSDEVVFPEAIGGINCSKNPIYCHIKTVKPSLNIKFAMRLSNLLHKYSRKYKTNPFISVAIIMQESSFRMTDRKEKGYVTLPDGSEVIDWVVTDVSMYQFHVNTIEYYEMDVARLRTDLDYATEEHTKLLALKVKMCTKKGIPSEEAWTCYHSATRRYRLQYLRHVSRYLP